jgi:hypothetical protein
MRLVAKRRDDGIVFNEALAEEGAVVFAKTCEMGLEGLRVEARVQLNRSGLTRNWPKTKNANFVRT